jgi:hypothetical protein
MKYILFIFLLLSVLGCATFEEKYACNKKFSFNGKDYLQLCQKKNSSDDPNRWGMINSETKEFILKPSASEIWHYSTFSYFKNKQDKTFSKVFYKTGETEETNIVWIWKVQAYRKTPYDKRTQGRVILARTTENDIYALSYSTGEPFLENKISNIDMEHFVNKEGIKLNFSLNAPFHGFLIRHKVDGKKFYKTYHPNGKLMSNLKIPAEKVVLRAIYRDYSSVIIPFREIDEMRRLYMPLIFNDKGLVSFEDKGIIGFIDYSTAQYRSKFYNKEKEIAYFHHLAILFKDKGKEVVAVMNEGRDWKVGKFNFEKIVDETIKKPEYTDFSIVMGRDYTYPGIVYNRLYAVYKNKKGKLVHAERVGSVRMSSSYNSLDELNDFVEFRTAEAPKLSSDFFFKKRRDDRLSREIEERFQNRQKKQKQDANAHRSKIKAAQKAKDDKLWKSVSGKLQQMRSQDKKREKCKKYRSQNKQSFMRGDQKWFDGAACN